MRHASAVGDIAGTFTFLFTDVEESTRRWVEDREAMSAAMAVHDAVLREAIESRGGDIFKHTGDGVWAVFGSARAAADAALEAQRSLPVPVRIGLNTGEAEHRDGDWFGTALNRTARIGDAGAGGQILCSSATAELLGAYDVRVLGQFRLKGLEGAEVIFQVGDGEFPPPRAVGVMANIPERSTTLVGRDRLLAELDELLDSERLVTLIGPGGVGKTSVAIEAARRRIGRIDRIGFADLTTTDDSNRLLSTISSAFEMRVTTLDELADALDRGQALLVLDNCEHLINEVADLVEELAHTASSLTVLATSREVLEIAGERVVIVAPLDSSADLVSLFRARAAVSGHELAAGDDDLVAELCRRLDGLPLAIELAAARLSVMSIEEMLDNLDERLTLLVAGRRRGRDRHRTMQDTIAWSYELLSPEEQQAYMHLGVYIDWFDNDDASAVTGLGRFPTMEVLEALVAKSLLVVDLAGTKRRYRLLESIRDHALQELRGRGRHDEAMATMASHIADKLAATADEILHGEDAEPMRAMRRLAPLQQHACLWAIEADDVDLAVRLVTPYVDVLFDIHWEVFTVSRLLERHDLGDLPPLVGAIDLWRRIYRLERGVWREGLTRMEALFGALENIEADARVVLGFAATLVGDLETVDRCRGGWLELGHPRSVIEVAAPSATYRDEYFDRLLAVANGSAPNYVRRQAALAAAYAAMRSTDPELWQRGLTLCNQCAEWFPPESDLHSQAHFSALQMLYQLGQHRECASRASGVFQSAAHRGVWGNKVPPVVALLLILRDLDLAEAACRLRPKAPKRWSVYFVDQIPSFTDWYDRIDHSLRQRCEYAAADLPLDDIFEEALEVIADCATS